ncbi:probable tRNA (uracil-O(2)-)-methyltransferase [Anopheles ziemanni]|uniref:probable tRNA (uracil-O(2)-)-methyltransferase n=1 Tax=Anopheles coustani TaxID=139045 RepID=UPI00265AE8DB|nr:probable tRNA (uracil-O(2)-)-methyltransferase [Anopheles coustani]XP_058178508.1 probable tRNA (uracil-O(2)-)-methyltransferase [Anopheles ziemanni]
MFEQVIGETSVRKDCVHNFWKAVDIYLFKTHVVNKKLFGVKTLALLTIQHTERPVFDHALLDDLCAVPLEQFVDQTRQIFAQRNTQLTEEARDHASVDQLSQKGSDGVVVLNRLIPKNIGAFQTLDVVGLIDYGSRSVLLKCRQTGEENSLFPKFAFSLQIIDDNLSIRYESAESNDERSIFWLREILLGRMQKWMESAVPTNATGVSTSSIRSLALVDNLEEYNCLFNELKQKYGLSMVSIWPECTDPQKFVFEDIAIAAYLLMLWRKERTETGEHMLQSFVDIGCGNGLLVYILASEGHRGYGIDLRKRKLWDLYPSGVVYLREQTLVPSNSSLFPDIDWIIGNHSDELSPWIPVIAARSSYRCRFFLLPCCAYEFDGSKYQRQNCNLSQYGDFLNYANHIAEICGFRVETDRLRIPSTKRTCLVGGSRNYPASVHDEHDSKIQAFINDRTKVTNASVDEPLNTVNDTWSSSFKPRESTEKVRNCTQVDRSVIDKIVMLVFGELLAKRKVLPEFTNVNWNSGGTITIANLVKTIPQEQLTALKAECGGLQTLLRNNHQIFRVESGTVQIRIPTKVSEIPDAGLAKKMKKVKNFKPINFKQRVCWFFANHPDGCPLEERECRFNHGS